MEQQRTLLSRSVSHPVPARFQYQRNGKLTLSRIGGKTKGNTETFVLVSFFFVRVSVGLCRSALNLGSAGSVNRSSVVLRSGGKNIRSKI